MARRGTCCCCKEKADLYEGSCLGCLGRGKKCHASHADYRRTDATYASAMVSRDTRPHHGFGNLARGEVNHRGHHHPPPGTILRARDRAHLKPNDYALPEREELPIYDYAHAKNAPSRLEMMRRLKHVTPAEYMLARKNIAAASLYFGIHSKYLA